MNRVIVEAVEYANSITDDKTLQDIIYSSYLEGYTKATKDYTESIRSIRKIVDGSINVVIGDSK